VAQLGLVLDPLVLHPLVLLLDIVSQVLDPFVQVVDLLVLLLTILALQLLHVRLLLGSAAVLALQNPFLVRVEQGLLLFQVLFCFHNSILQIFFLFVVALLN
jgi:hypothetical protein